MISIIIPAHNESLVIERTLSALTSGAAPGELDIVVVCNGCTDNTAAQARRFGGPVRVLETAFGNKPHALNLGDQAARGYPRIYVDADVLLTLGAVRALAQRLVNGDAIAVAPRPEFDLAGCSWAVSAFYGVRSRLPSFNEGIGGSGVYALSKIGRDRFGEFPNLVADDAFVRIQFKPEERATFTSVKSIVFAPRNLKNLITIETRADFGNFELSRQYPQLWANRGVSNLRMAMELFKYPHLWPGLLVYFYVRNTARRKARKLAQRSAFSWERDETSRARPSASDLTAQRLG